MRRKLEEMRWLDLVGRGDGFKSLHLLGRIKYRSFKRKKVHPHEATSTSAIF